MVTAYGVAALSFMMAMYVLEWRGRVSNAARRTKRSSSPSCVGGSVERAMGALITHGDQQGGEATHHWLLGWRCGAS
jgi:hypothetical protein